MATTMPTSYAVNTTEETNTSQISGNDTQTTGIYLRICQVVNGTMLCIVIWILICMILYGVKKKKFFVKSEGGRLYVVCFVVIILALPRYVLNQIRFAGPNIPGVSEHCKLLDDISDTNCGVFLLGVYLVLWMRQRAIYAHPFMQATNGLCAKVYSWATLIVLITSAVSFMCGFLLPQTYEATAYGCVKTREADGGSNTWENLKYYALGAVMVLSEGMLLAGFIYPMVRLKMKGTQGKKSSRSGEADTIVETIRRSLLCVIIAVLSELTTAILAAKVVPRHYSAALRDALYDVDMFVNILCIFAIFGKSREILTVFCKRKQAGGSLPSSSA